MGSKNNRFINPEMASKNRIQPPSKILHFFNTPPGMLFNTTNTLKPSQRQPTTHYLFNMSWKTFQQGALILQVPSSFISDIRI